MFSKFKIALVIRLNPHVLEYVAKSLIVPNIFEGILFNVGDGNSRFAHILVVQYDCVDATDGRFVLNKCSVALNANRTLNIFQDRPIRHCPKVINAQGSVDVVAWAAEVAEIRDHSMIAETKVIHDIYERRVFIFSRQRARFGVSPIPQIKARRIGNFVNSLTINYRKHSLFIVHPNALPI